MDVEESISDRLIEKLRKVNPPAKTGKKFINAKIPEDSFWHLKKISLDKKVSINELICKGINVVLEAEHKPTFEVERPIRGRPPQPK